MTNTLNVRSQTNKWKYIVIGVVVSSLISLGLPARTQAMSVPQLSATVHSSSQTVGSSYIVTINYKTRTPTDAVTATLTYDPTYVRYEAIDTTSSGFPVELPTQYTSNSVTITRGIFAPATVKSNVVVATVRFTVLKKSGVACFNLSGNATFQGVYLNPTSDRSTLYVHSR